MWLNQVSKNAFGRKCSISKNFSVSRKGLITSFWNCFSFFGRHSTGEEKNSRARFLLRVSLNIMSRTFLIQIIMWSHVNIKTLCTHTPTPSDQVVTHQSTQVLTLGVMKKYWDVVFLQAVWTTMSKTLLSFIGSIPCNRNSLSHRNTSERQTCFLAVAGCSFPTFNLFAYFLLNTEVNKHKYNKICALPFCFFC